MNTTPKHPKRSAISDNLPMIIILDTTVPLQDPQLRAGWWAELDSTARRVGARLVVPEVVFAESVAHHNRTIEALVGQAENFGNKVKRYGLDAIRDAAVKAIREKVDAYENALRSHLVAMGVEFVPPVQVDHMTLIDRAVAFRKPWDESERKDGYRDTLNWLTVLELAKQNPGEEVWWVSDNSGDFGNGDGENDAEWHPQIADELQSAGLLDLVKWTRTVFTLFAALADRTAPIPDADKENLLKKLSAPELAGLISSEVLAKKLDPKDAALPRDTDSAEITSFAGLTSDVKWESLAGSGDGNIVGRFVACVSLGLDLIQESSGVATVSFRRKEFDVTGVATLTHDGRITALSVTSIEALENDPGHAAWGDGIIRPSEPFLVVKSKDGENVLYTSEGLRARYEARVKDLTADPSTRIGRQRVRAWQMLDAADSSGAHRDLVWPGEGVTVGEPHELDENDENQETE